MYLFQSPDVHVYLSGFSEFIQKHILFCKYFGAIFVASFVPGFFQYYVTIFHNTAPNKVVIKLIKLRKQNVQLKYIKDINQLVIKQEVLSVCVLNILPKISSLPSLLAVNFRNVEI